MMRDKAWDEAVRVVRDDAHGLVSVRDDLVARWSESHRGYHDLRHLDEVLTALEQLRESTLDTDAEWATVVFAAWFHDAVYDIVTAHDVDAGDTQGAVSNEERSAELARKALSASAIDRTVVADTVSLVLASQEHNVIDTRGPHAAFHDADLWILSAPQDRFDDYCRAVRREYAAAPDDAYAHGRSEILRPFLTRESVYRTMHARHFWEAAARSNLARELDRLGQPHH